MWKRQVRQLRFYSTAQGPLISDLESRGLISQLAGKELGQQTKPLSVYLGADPSAPSLHLGNLLPLMVLAHFYVRGHTAVPLVGGATGVVGDPSGRNTERSQQEALTRANNVKLLGVQFKQILENSVNVASKYMDVKPGQVKPVNNADWWAGMGMLEFLGTYGRYIRLSAMLGRESVKQRLKSEQGLGYAEFSYQVLQAFDFWHLYSHENVSVQIGGHDQWGNITAGIDLIGRLKDPKGPEPNGITVPLLTTPSGEKFGKSAGNAVFLSADETKPYHMYQHLLKSPDDVVEKYLRIFTFMSLDEISALMAEHQRNPETRQAQHRLATEVTELVHGEEVAANSRTISSVLFDSEGPSHSPDEILEAFRSQGLVRTFTSADVVGQPWRNIIAKISGRSKSESHRLHTQRAVYIGLRRQIAEKSHVSAEDIDASLLLLRIGKTEYHIIEISE